MGVITVIKEIKAIHPTDITLVKLGGFYRAYGKDAYILSNIFKYKLKEDENIVSCGFPIKTINKVLTKLEDKKINYIICDSRDNYNIEEKMDYKNLNKYESEYETSRIYVNNQIRIEKINNYLIKNASKNELRKLLKEIEDIINAKGKI